MVKIGYTLSSEEHSPTDLVEYARHAEEAGFDFLSISDHYHPWISDQGHSPFVWSTLGGIATATEDIDVGVGVSAPIIRFHPAIYAQAAATAAEMFDGRKFYAGIGTGEKLNEHVLGDHWPEHAVRLEMLEEAVAVVRKLWTGEEVSHHGEHYTVENARIYTRPESPPPIHVAAEGPTMADAASDLGDGLITTTPDESIVERFSSGGGGDRPRYGQMAACYAADEETAAELAHEHWRISALPGELGQELPTPAHFEQATQSVSSDDVAEGVALGSDPDPYVERIEEYVDAGYENVYVHQVNPDADGFFDLFEADVIPQFA
jgi:G6PDH family F420-dependent oxidoreductase